MPALRKKVPSYRLHKPSGQAVVTINAHDHYLGRYGSVESFEKYKQLIAAWAADAQGTARAESVSQDAAHLTIDELLLSYLQFAKDYYVKNGKATNEFVNIKHAVRPLAESYGDASAANLGPLQLKAVRERMIDSDLSRKVINSRVNRIRRVFSWAVENQLIPPSTLQALRAVAPLTKGHTRARETEPVKPVPDHHVEAVLPLVTKQVQAMIKLQRLTGMRPGEVVMMRQCDLDMSEGVWAYRPSSHKTEHHGIDRVIFLGPKAQAVVKPFLGTQLGSHLFSPAAAMQDIRQHCMKRASRKKQKQHPQKSPGHHYTAASYLHAIHNACKKAGVPCWGPNRLRHNAATLLRKQHGLGLEAARVVLGHRTAAITEVYAEQDLAKAAQIMAQLG